MITIKTQEDIKNLREGGRRLAAILVQLAAAAKPGVSSIDIDKLGQRLVEEAGDKPAFLGYRPEGVRVPYPASVCVSVNDEVVHGIPKPEKILQSGDVVAIDMGLIHKGLITDAAITIVVGEAADDVTDEQKQARVAAEKLVKATKMALQKGIEAVKPGNTVGDIGYAIERYVKQFGYGQAEGLAGHGVGYKVHEDPYVPNTGELGEGEELLPGMVIAIEPMLNEGTSKVSFSRDSYTVRTKDGKRSAHFEHTVAVTDTGYLVLTEL